MVAGWGRADICIDKSGGAATAGDTAGPTEITADTTATAWGATGCNVRGVVMWTLLHEDRDRIRRVHEHTAFGRDSRIVSPCHREVAGYEHEHDVAHCERTIQVIFFNRLKLL